MIQNDYAIGKIYALINLGAINKKINNTYGLIICKSSIAGIYIKQNNPQKAINLIKSNIEPAKKLGNKELVLIAKLGLLLEAFISKPIQFMIYFGL